MVATSDQEELVKLLQGVPLFAGMNIRHLRRLAKEGKPLSFSAGEKIIKKGDMGTGARATELGRGNSSEKWRFSTMVRVPSMLLQVNPLSVSVSRSGTSKELGTRIPK